MAVKDYQAHNRLTISNRQLATILSAVFVSSLILSAYTISWKRSLPSAEQIAEQRKVEKENEFLAAYKPDNRVLDLRQELELTPLGERFFYLSNPSFIMSNLELVEQCSSEAKEHVATLGCYQSNNSRIFILDTDAGMTRRLIAPTTAHELLHAVYKNLPLEEKSKIDFELGKVANGKNAEYLKSRIAAYGALTQEGYFNELHSIVGSEILDLPLDLELHYARYFNQNKVATVTAAYRNELNTNINSANLEDAKLKMLKDKINLGKSQISKIELTLAGLKRGIQIATSTNSESGYNFYVSMYNEKIIKINHLKDETNMLINRYNETAHHRNLHSEQIASLNSTEKI